MGHPANIYCYVIGKRLTIKQGMWTTLDSYVILV